jgi:hypothetical protein
VNTIKIQEWRMPTITGTDQKMVDRGYRAFFRRRGIRVAEGFRDIVAGYARSGKAAKARKAKGDA